MKTVANGRISAAQDAQRQNDPQANAVLVEIDLPESGTQRYADRTITIGGNAYLNLVKGVKTLSQPFPSDPVAGSVAAADVLFVELINVPDDVNRPELLVGTDRFEGSEVRLYTILLTGGALAAGDRILLQTYRIDRVDFPDVATIRLRLVDCSLGVGERASVVAVRPQDWPRADVSAQGAVVPHIFGDVPDCPLLPVNVGGRSKTSGTVEATETHVRLRELSDDPAMPYYFRATPADPLTVQIGAEQITVRGIDYPNRLLGSLTDPSQCERGANGTTPARHSDGTAVQEVASWYEFAVAAHACRAVSNIRAGGRVISVPGGNIYTVVKDGKTFQIVRLTEIPQWTEPSHGLQMTRVERMAAWSQGSPNTPGNAVAAILHPDTRYAAILDRTYHELTLNGNYSPDAEARGNLVKATLCLDYNANPQRYITGAGDPEIWNPGDFKIGLVRNGQELLVGDEIYLNAPRRSECAVSQQAHNHLVGVFAGTGSSTAAFLRDGEEAKRTRRVKLSPRAMNQTRYQEYTTLRRDIGSGTWECYPPRVLVYASLAACQAECVGWPNECREILQEEVTVAHHYDGGKWSLVGGVGISNHNQMQWSGSQSSVLSDDSEHGLWNFAIALAVHPWESTVFDDETESENVAWEADFEEGEADEVVEQLRIKLRFWVPNWNSSAGFTMYIRNTSLGPDHKQTYTMPAHLVVPTDGSDGAVTYETTILPGDQPGQLQWFLGRAAGTQVTMADLKDLDIYLDFGRVSCESGAPNGLGDPGSFESGSNHVLLTSVLIDATIRERLDGSATALTADADVETPITWTYSSRATQRIDLTHLIAEHGWSLFDSTTELRLRAWTGADNRSRVRPYNIYWEIEHEPNMVRSGFGDVVADVQGYKRSDTDALIDNPADILACLLTNRTADNVVVTDADFAGLPNSAIDSATFQDVRSALWVMAWTLARRADGETAIRDLIASAAAESRLRLWFEGSKYFLKFLPIGIPDPTSGAPAVTRDHLVHRAMGREYTSVAQIVNQLVVGHSQDYTNGKKPRVTVVRGDETSQEELWDVRSRAITLLWHQNSRRSIVENLVSFYLSRLAEQRMTLNLCLPLRFLNMERGDVLEVTHADYGLDSAPAEIVGWHLDGSRRLAATMLVSAGPAVFWKSGVCAIIVTAAESSILFYYNGILIAKIDHYGNFHLRGNLVGWDGSSYASRSAGIECDASNDCLRLNALTGLPSSYTSAIRLKSNGDLASDWDMHVVPGYDFEGWSQTGWETIEAVYAFPYYYIHFSLRDRLVASFVIDNMTPPSDLLLRGNVMFDM